MRIGYVLPRLNWGGSEKHLLQLASGLRQRGHEVMMTCLFQEGLLAPEARAREIPLVCLDLPYRWGARTLFGLFKSLRAHPVDVLHTCLFGFHLFTGLPARLLKVPVILSSRREIGWWQTTKHRWTENLGNLFVDRVLCCSKAVEEWTREKERIAPEKLITLYNGVDLARFASPSDSSGIRRRLGIPEEAPLIGTVANFAVEKGYPYLLDAAREILRKKPEAWFLFVGFGPLEKEMKEKAGELPGRQQIIFAGARHDIPDLIGAMDIFVLASVIEGFPNVLLEALAMAKPVVATRVGGIPELVDSGVDGILVPPADGPSLAEALLTLIRNREEASQMGSRGRKKVEQNFSLESMIDRYEDFYFSVLEEKGLAKRNVKICAAS